MRERDGEMERRGAGLQLTIRGVGLEDGDGLFVLSEIPETHRPISPPDGHQVRLIGTPV